MRFKLTTKSGSIVWEDVKLSGDQKMVEKLEKELKMAEGFWVAPPSFCGTNTDHLNAPLSVVTLARELFGNLKFEGDPIPLPEGPEDTEGVDF